MAYRRGRVKLFGNCNLIDYYINPKFVRTLGPRKVGRLKFRRTVRCELCGRRFVSETTLRMHSQSVPNCGKMTTCPTCGCPVKERNLARHMRRVHAENYQNGQKVPDTAANDGLQLAEVHGLNAVGGTPPVAEQPVRAKLGEGQATADQTKHPVRVKKRKKIRGKAGAGRERPQRRAKKAPSGVARRAKAPKKRVVGPRASKKAPRSGSKSGRAEYAEAGRPATKAARGGRSRSTPSKGKK
jgi:hypothetical protein